MTGLQRNSSWRRRPGRQQTGGLGAVSARGPRQPGSQQWGGAALTSVFRVKWVRRKGHANGWSDVGYCRGRCPKPSDHDIEEEEGGMPLESQMWGTAFWNWVATATAKCKEIRGHRRTSNAPKRWAPRLPEGQAWVVQVGCEGWEGKQIGGQATIKWAPGGHRRSHEGPIEKPHSAVEGSLSSAGQGIRTLRVATAVITRKGKAAAVVRCGAHHVCLVARTIASNMGERDLCRHRVG